MPSRDAAISPLVPMPLPPAWVISGAPAPKGRVLVTSPDGRTVAGTWECGSGTFRYRHHSAETIRIEAGEAVIETADGVATRMQTGDMAHFPAGSDSVWQIATYVRKTFFLLKAEPAPSPSDHQG